MSHMLESTPRRRSMAVATIVAALTAVIAMTPAVATAQSDAGVENRCYGVQGSGSTSFDPTQGGFAGIATFRLGGQAQEVSAVAYVTGPESTSHVFEFAQGTIVTDDQLILKPLDPAAGQFELRSRLSVVDGGSGQLHILPGSTLDLVAGTASWEMRGNVCFD
jgi:uncharacterized membrane protein